MPDKRTLLGYVPPKIGLGIVVLAAVFTPYRYLVDGPHAAFGVVLASFLLLWLLGWGYSELRRMELDALENEHDPPDREG